MSPASQSSQSKVLPHHPSYSSTHLTARQPFKLDTTLPARQRSDSDEAPPSVIHAPANFKTFVCCPSHAMAPLGADLPAEQGKRISSILKCKPIRQHGCSLTVDSRGRNGF